MTRREMNRAIFARERVPHVFFQPRMESWYDWHRRFDRMPAPFREKSLLDIYDEMDLSMRYVHYYTGQPDPITVRYSDEVKITHRTEGSHSWRIFETPLGDLVETYTMTVDGVWRETGYPVKTRDDLKKVRWIFENATYHFDPAKFDQGNRFVGDRGEPGFWVPKSPYLALAQWWMRMEHLIYALADWPEDVHTVMQAIDAAYDPLYEELAAARDLKIINFGENVHEAHMSPRYFETYLIPWYEKRSGQLRRAGIYTHNHIDGYFRSLLRYLKDLPFDGLEALTPQPQGDVTLDEIEASIGDKILMDGIPAVLFLPHHPMEELQACVEEIVRRFHPRLILGISDELPEGSGYESVERVRWVAEYCAKTAA
jgi:hypothetical protein